MDFHFAPVQGHTDAPYRHFHSIVYEGNPTYYTPFIRLEQGGIRNKDIKDFTSPLNDGTHLVPQIIFRDTDELTALIDLVKQQGAKEINLNMGCPFPLQTGHRRGAATVANGELSEKMIDIFNDNPDIMFSVKMRLGFNDPDDWKILLPNLNKTKLAHITVHPRIAKQQYAGDLYMDRFARIVEESVNPIIFNGDIKSPDDIAVIAERFPSLAGIMIGRGLLARPSLIAEYNEGKEWDKVKRIGVMLDFHKKLLNHYSSVLCGDSQIISKIKPFWEYAEEEIGRKPWKAIKKASNIAKYHSAVAMIE